jgi:uncharacterized repeat protein (TIGR03803 family)
MIQTKVTRMLELAGFAPAGNPGYANPQERFGFTERRASMKRVVNALGKLSWGRRAYAVFALCATTAIVLPAQTLTTVFSFDGTDGAYPWAGLVQATNGDFYGTTLDGGANTNKACIANCGTVFKITPGGTLTTLHSFCSESNCTDGCIPYAALVQATDGDFYGTTQDCANGDGTLFKITPSGTLTTLYSFCSESNCTDGSAPSAVLIQAIDGNLYGTTSFGGANCATCGTVFKITPSGTLTTLLSFDGADGEDPTDGLVQGPNGDFYGTTYIGGAYGDGTVFKITPEGTLTTLVSFDGTNGSSPVAGLVQTTNGDLYGTTQFGGAYGGGTVFKITPSGTLTTLHSFHGGTDGANPDAGGLVQGTDGDFYGTTSGGGAYGDGTVFKITPEGTLTTLISFDGTDGSDPIAGLVQATNGTFYGTTRYGGADNDGTVFSLSVGLGPFVETRLTAGTVGAVVEILGTDLTGATSVSFNGTAAAFTVVSPSLVAATVPAGATSGKVQVVTPSGTLLSNVPFRVLP